VIVVPAITAVPEAARMSCPTVRVPVGVPVTVSVVSAIVALNATAPVPTGQYAPAGQPDPDTVSVPRVVTLMAHIVVHAVALGEIWNVFAPGLHTYVGTVTSVAAVVGHPVPVIGRVLPTCVK
jgi:hypothetical protein